MESAWARLGIQGPLLIFKINHLRKNSNWVSCPYSNFTCYLIILLSPPISTYGRPFFPDLNVARCIPFRKHFSCHKP
jgi:hypothetical protein